MDIITNLIAIVADIPRPLQANTALVVVIIASSLIYSSTVHHGQMKLKFYCHTKYFIPVSIIFKIFNSFDQPFKFYVNSDFVFFLEL